MIDQSPETRAAIVRLLCERMPSSEIAKQCRVPVGVVRETLCLAPRIFAALLERHLAGARVRRFAVQERRVGEWRCSVAAGMDDPVDGWVLAVGVSEWRAFEPDSSIALLRERCVWLRDAESLGPEMMAAAVQRYMQDAIESARQLWDGVGFEAALWLEAIDFSWDWDQVRQVVLLQQREPGQPASAASAGNGDQSGDQSEGGGKPMDDTDRVDDDAADTVDEDDERGKVRPRPRGHPGYRPPRGATVRKVPFAVLLSPDERGKAAALADEAGLSMQKWARRCLLQHINPGAAQTSSAATAATEAVDDDVRSETVVVHRLRPEARESVVSNFESLEWASAPAAAPARRRTVITAEQLELLEQVHNVLITVTEQIVAWDVDDSEVQIEAYYNARACLARALTELHWAIGASTTDLSPDAVKRKDDRAWSAPEPEAADEMANDNGVKRRPKAKGAL